MNLYYIQDDDRPLYVLANSMEHAISKYKDKMIEENDGDPGPPIKGVTLIAEQDDILL